MYRKQITKKTSLSLSPTLDSKAIIRPPSYGSLSSVVQKIQQDPKSVNEDERQQLDNAIGTRATREILGGKQTPWVPKFKGISDQIWGDSAQISNPIQAKEKDKISASKVQSENKTGLPDNLKVGIETLSGMAMDDVRVHYNSPTPDELQALAYTQGTNIYVAPGQEKHLPHEAWHVIQQKQGRIKPTMHIKGVAINDDNALEHEADVMGAQARQIKPAGELQEETLENQVRMQFNHERSCNCPSCMGLKTQFRSISPAKPQIIKELVIQEKPCPECGKEKGHKSNCSRHQHNRTAITKEKEKKHEENQSWKNLQCYRPGWVRQNDITEEDVRQFCQQYAQRKIRGHCSADEQSQEHKNTTTDLDAFKSWYTKKYGWQ